MWFFLALLSSISFTALWILTRLSKGMPSNAVTALQAAPGPFILWYATRDIDLPWNETLWQWYLIFPLLLMPLGLWALTAAVHRTEVSLVKPITALSSICTLIVAFLFFHERVSAYGIMGICIITIGLFLLYHGRFGAWKRSGPWLALLGTVIIGVNAALLAGVIDIFPYIFALTGFTLTATLVINGAVGGKSWASVEWSQKNILITLGMMLANVAQALFTMVAFLYGSAAYVIAIKRTSILLTAFVGYVFLHERDQSLKRLLLASGLVVLGAIALTLG